ncbi:Vacuolar protein-sorting-associated protein 36 [Dispira parvispora]|uniref:Vacuolar protein-sorting-associated protein 36 n=1 Tax=Dispira parvispora TaxID=1520584 RepID=A0A9W8APZ5_9FUNG|nr:Vacuolar protein-sorting-associated protein 36 [Dispira parvispora]
MRPLLYFVNNVFMYVIETCLFRKANTVTIYDIYWGVLHYTTSSNKKDLAHNDGNLYLTPLRLLYVDSARPHQRSLSLELSLVNYFTSQSGFLTSSPKLTLYLFHPSTTSETDGSQHGTLSTLESTANLGSINSVAGGDSDNIWQCTICQTDNLPQAAKCALCGVVKRNSQGNSSSLAPITPSISTAGKQSDTTSRACPACTFINHPSMAYCELCSTSLRPKPPNKDKATPPIQLEDSNSSPGISSSSPAVAESSQTNNKVNPYRGIDFIKLSFRNSGSTTFATALQKALDERAWTDTHKDRTAGQQPNEVVVHDILDTHKQYRTISAPFYNADGTLPNWRFRSMAETKHKAQERATEARNQPRLGGISQVVNRVDASHKATDDTLTDAFQDLDALMAKAQHMVRLAEKLVAKSSIRGDSAAISPKTTGSSVATSPASSHGAGGDDHNLTHWLNNLGIDSPVTKNTAGAIYHQELAKELEEFLENILPRTGGMMSLVDVYCLFNRARGVALVSPEDMYKACQLFPSLGLSLQLTRFPSGLLAIRSADQSDDVIAQRFTQLLQTFGAMSALELANYEQLAVPLIAELLLIVEARGDICRDDSLQGLMFYPNRFRELAQK